MTACSTVDEALTPRVAGDDWVFEFDPDADAEPGSADDMATWSDLLVVMRRGATRNSELVASSAPTGSIVPIDINGHTFSGPGGRVVAPTDFTVPFMSWVLLSAGTTTIVPVGTNTDLYVAAQVKIAGVLTTVIPATLLPIRAESAL